jgi:hypothetical protein
MSTRDVEIFEEINNFKILVLKANREDIINIHKWKRLESASNAFLIKSRRNE